MPGTVGAVVVVLGFAGDPLASDSVRHVLERERCQTELPLAGTAVTPGAAARGPAAPPVEAETGTIAIPLPVPSPVLAAVVTGVGIAAVLALLLRRLPAPSALPPPGPSPTRPPGGRPARAAAPDEPDRLARQGRFAEAIHALLLRALADLGDSARPALTSREVLRGSPLAAEARAALGALVSAVEWAHFGARPAGPADYEASLAEYHRLQRAWRRHR